MRISVSGPRIGPVRTTLWSSGRRKRGGGKVAAAVFLVPALVLLAVACAPLFRYWGFDLAVAVLIGLGVLGWREQRNG